MYTRKLFSILFFHLGYVMFYHPECVPSCMWTWEECACCYGWMEYSINANEINLNDTAVTLAVCPYWFQPEGSIQLLMKVSGILQLERGNFSLSSLTSVRFTSYIFILLASTHFRLINLQGELSTLTYFHPQCFSLSWNLVSQVLASFDFSFID